MEIPKSEKKRKLKALDDEVDDFHPLLESLFNRLPRVNRVEYTHGKFEFGADFVLSRLDDALNIIEYIGVIAKTKKIHQDISDIEKQIDECDEKRYFENGKKEITLDEIWIVTNNYISQGAKKKINRKFRSRKIKLIMNDSLVDLIDQHYDLFWYKIPLPISEYLEDIRNEIDSLDSSLNLISRPGENFYIKPDIDQIEYDYNDLEKLPKRNKSSQVLSIDKIILENDLIFMEGRAGFGKSKLSRYTVKHFANPLIYQKHKIIPFYISYNEFVEDFDRDIDKFLIQRFNGNLEDEIYKNSEKLIVLDGFDEKYLEKEGEEEFLIDLLNNIKDKDKFKILVTSRPLSPSDYDKFEEVSIEWYEIQPLTIEKIIEFFELICEKSKISTRIIDDIRTSQLFKQLPRSPIATILLANLINENSSELPSNLTELYKKYTELMLGRWDISKGLQSQREYEAAQAIITQISKYFIENELEYISIDEAKNFFRKYLNKRNLNINHSKLFEKVTNRSGIIRVEKNKNRLKFKHRTFIEFFYAVSKLNENDPAFIDNRVYSIYWRNIYFFYVGLLKDCEEVIENIFRVEPANISEKFQRILNLGDYLLAAYVTPYDVISHNFEKIIREVSNLYLDIIKKKVETGLEFLSEMGLLIILQSIIRKSYGYNFFERAVEDSILNILSDPKYPKTNKIYATYFQSIIMIELEKDNPFDGLLEEFGQELPMQIKLGIEYEDVDKVSKALKKQRKRFKRKWNKRDQSMQVFVQNLLEKPISEKETQTE